MNPTTTQHSHTQLYIVVGLLLLFAILFFTIKIGQTPASPPIAAPTADSTPFELKRLVMPAEEIAAQEKSIVDSSKIVTLTPAQQTKQEKAFSTEVTPTKLGEI